MSLDPFAETRLAFDSVAASYDGPSGNNGLIRRLRAKTMAAVTRLVPPGDTLLDLGCGTGLDAAFLAEAGYSVTAIDSSPEMVHRTEQRAAQAGFTGHITARHLGIQQLDQLLPASLDGGSFAAAYSDLGPLNCVPDLPAAARDLARLLRPGGLLIASVIGRFCPWELALFAARGHWARARIRFARGMVPVPLNGLRVWTRYLSPREFARAFAAAGFRPLELRALGLLVPPPYMDAFAARHPRLIDRLARLEDRVAAWPLLRNWGDHFLVALRSGG